MQLEGHVVISVKYPFLRNLQNDMSYLNLLVSSMAIRIAFVKPKGLADLPMRESTIVAIVIIICKTSNKIYVTYLGVRIIDAIEKTFH